MIDARRAGHICSGVLALALSLAAAGCSKKSVSVVAPRPEPPVVSALFPPARATAVRYDTGIWIEFGEALDAATINTDNIFFKLDTVRYPIALEWDPASRRLRIVPRDPLKLRRTYTIEITGRVRTASGRKVGDPFLWQFTTNSVRRLEDTIPADGTPGESPFAMLGWDSTETAAGPMEYTLWTATDSASVANRTVAPTAFASRGFWIPRRRWAQGERIFWTVRAKNLETGEFEDGALCRFDVLPAVTPTEPVNLPIVDWGSWNQDIRRVICRGTVYAGTFMNNGFYWNLASLGRGLRVASADVTIPLSFEPSNINTLQLNLSATTTGYSPCAVTREVPAPDPLELAFGVRRGTSTDYVYSSDYFAAHVEAAARYGVVWGYTIRSNQYIFLAMGGTRGVLNLSRYVSPPAAPAVLSAAPPAAHGSRLPTARREDASVFTRP